MHFSHSFGFGAARSAALASVALSAVAIGAAFAQTAAPPTAAPGFSVRVFAASPAGASEPDSIAMVGDRAWIGYGDGGKPDGSGGAKSSIVEFSADGKALRTLTLAGHNDGLRLDPRSGKLWAIQNEDSDPNLVVIDPATGAMSAPYAFPATAHGGGYDDVTFKDGAAYISASNPKTDAKGAVVGGPAVIEATLGADHKVAVLPALDGKAVAADVVTGAKGALNLTDPDSMVAAPGGELMLDSQDDSELVFFRPAKGAPAGVKVLHLLGGAKVDDTVFVTAPRGHVLIADTKGGTVYRLDAPAWSVGSAFSAVGPIKAGAKAPAYAAYVGAIDLHSGAAIPVASGFANPHGMAFVADK